MRCAGTKHTHTSASERSVAGASASSRAFSSTRCSMRRCSARFRRTLSVAAAAASVALSTVRVHDLRRSALALFTSLYSCCSAVCRACACPEHVPMVRHAFKSAKGHLKWGSPSCQIQQPLLRSGGPQSAFRSRAAALRAQPPQLVGHACAWPAAPPRQTGDP